MGREAEEERLSGVTLAQYAGVTAALADEHPLEAALAAYGVASADWGAARAAWLKRIGAAGKGTALFTAYQDELFKAEDALGRKVEPLDDDLTAFLVFLDLCGREKDLPAFLEKLELRSPDLSRVGRIWKRRFAADPSYEGRIAELRKAGLPDALPPLVLGTSVLPRGAAAAPSAPARPSAAPVAPSSGADWEHCTLDRYALIRAELDAGDALASAIGRAGLDEAAWSRADHHYREAFARDPQLERDFRALRAHADRTVRSRGPASAPLAPQAALSGPAPLGIAQAAPPGPAPAPAPAPVPVSPAPALAPAPAAPAPAARRPAPVTEELRIPVRGTPPPMPFVMDPTKPPPEPIPVPVSQRKVAVPGAPSKAMSGTLDGGFATPKPLPFSGNAEPGAPVRSAGTKSPPQGTPANVLGGDGRGIPPSGPLPPYPAPPPVREIPPRRAGAGARALLTLEQHAALHAEIKAGHPPAEVNARWGLGEKERAEVDEHWSLAIQRDRRVWSAWDAAFRSFVDRVPKR